MTTKLVLAGALMALSTGASALTQEQSRGMIYARCAGTYLAAASVAYKQNDTQDYNLFERLVTVASAGATVRIGDVQTTKIGENTANRLLDLYQRNPILGEDRIARERDACAPHFEKNQ
jgi:hypothetical protein